MSIPALIVAYNLWVFNTNPVFRAWAEQNQVRSPHPLHYLLGYALVGGAAVGGLIWALRRHDERWWFPVAWVLVVPLLVYLPFGLQRRLAEGVMVPLGLLAAVGLTRYVLPWVMRSRPLRWLLRHPRYTPSKMRRFLVTAFFLLTLPTNLLLVAGNTGEVLRYPDCIFHSRGEVLANEWLRAHTAPKDTVLCALDTGNYVPARAGNRVFLGHTPETIRAEEKKQLVARFFSAAADDAWRQQFLREWGIAYVLYGPRERALGDFRPEEASYLQEVFAADGYVIYRVELNASPGGISRNPVFKEKAGFLGSTLPQD